MKRGTVLVEQVLKDGTIIEDYDTSLSVSEISDMLCKYFPGLEKGVGSPTFYVGEYKNRKYAIRCKNVTYLGNPHSIYKKRIQIADDLYDFYNKAISLGAEPILLGIYTYGDNTMFVAFKIDTYIKKKAHNSSAHVYSNDIYEAVVDDYFQKIDYFGNTVTVFKPEHVGFFLDEFFGLNNEYQHDTNEMIVNEDIHTYTVNNSESDESKYFDTLEKKPVELMSRSLTYAQKFKKYVTPEIKKFFNNVDKKWHGIDCYTKMIETNYKNKYQPEWVGFYLEYCFEKYIQDNNLENTVTYYQDKKDGGIDLDLFFPNIYSFGDLKAHSEDSRAIQGNDWNTIFSILDKNDETSHIYYIVCEHATEKDSEHNYEVTKFWNTKQNKDDLLSYHKRMKNNVTLKKVYILDINNDNKQYLTKFKQGINSNGKPRAPKIMIEHDNLKHFVIEEINL